MKLSAPFRVRVEKDVIVRIYRLLKGKGRLNVLKNQEVTPADIIGSSEFYTGFRTINLAKSLSVDPKEMERYLKRSLGERIYQGELLAYKSGGWFGGKKIIISPADGILDFLNLKTGEVRMKFLPKKVDLPSGVYGVVEAVNEERGLVIIRTQVSIIQGMFGSGRTRDGILRLISRREDLVTRAFISASLNEQILVGGSLIFKDAITAAISAGVNGLITGGINAKDYKSMAGGRLVFPKKLENDSGISLVVCEGFGSVPIGVDIYEILKQYNGRFVSVDGNNNIIRLPSFEGSSLIKVRNSHLPPLENKFIEGTTQMVDLKKGLKVRIIGNSYLGEQGKIISIDQTETLLPSGIKTFLVTVETQRRKIKVPVANLEVIDYSL